MSRSDARKPAARALTVAHIRDREGADYTEVLFLESARIYKLSKKNPAYSAMLSRLRAAFAQRRPVEIRCAPPDGEIIEEVKIDG